MTIPAMIKAKINISKPMPTPASLPNRLRLACLICGRYFAARSGRSVEACSQRVDSRSPINGQLATDSAGGGIWKSPPLTIAMVCSTESAIETPNR
ncbi:hypothetical protein D3C84_780900 [compost metagenome]